jgi:hypothetical protein
MRLVGKQRKEQRWRVFLDNDFEVWMIRVKGDPLSEAYANYCLPSWTEAGFDVQIYDAVTPETIKDQKNKLKFDPNWKFTPSKTEMGCFYSQFNLWNRSLEIDKPILILEHDAYLLKPEYIQYDSKFAWVYFGQRSMEACMISPKFAKKVTEYLNSKGTDFRPMTFVDGLLGLYSHYWAGRGVPYASFRGLEAPVKAVMDPEHGNTIEHVGVSGKMTADEHKLLDRQNDTMWVNLGLK